MKRKNFIANSTLLGLSVTALALDACKQTQVKDKSETTAQKSTDDFELNELTIDELQQMMKDGKHTARSLMEIYLKRIAVLDKEKLHAVLELNPDGLAEADKLDEERKNGKLRGPLHGIPVLIKDNINTANMHTTAGSLALQNYKPVQDAFIVNQLRAAGALILGKTNLSEWANIRSQHSTSGWSSKGGQTNNPYILDRNPCGSSSGSAVAVSANLCAVAVGTETDGSIVAPASVNGIVGLKPTVGLVSRTGIIPISATQDTAGPMARTVKDAAILLGAITGKDEHDSATGYNRGIVPVDYIAMLKRDALKEKRIGIEKNWKSGSSAINALYKNALDEMQKAGAILVEVELLEAINKLSQAEFTVLLFEFKKGLNKYLAENNAPVKSLSDLIAWNLKNEAKAMPYFKQEIFEAAEKTTGLDSTAYKDALAKSRDGSREIINSLISKNNLDAISGLTIGPACTTDALYGDRWGDINFASPAAMAGYPHITLPCGFVYQLPVGISFFGKPYSEAELLAIAYAYEQQTKSRKKPTFLHTFDAQV